ncbi:MAG: 50S ribosomal protein L6 [Armatimonadota bacterium]|nr:50S ribosomal protein L6 [Armatimonadota bacterium]MCX7776917.1 50S ribosomal protein L6 [Armatimonadota bacterium]MDW8024750.1 50S ribosomal protein L6 [Armatimonadota bacterium]
MSRIGRKPIPIPKEVTVQIDGNKITVEGPRGKIEQSFHLDMIIRKDDSQIIVERPSDSRFHKSLHGLTRTLIANMIEGVTKGFRKLLEVRGMGYKVELISPNKLRLYLGFSHPVVFEAPEGIRFEVETFTPTQQNQYLSARIAVNGIDKQLVGDVAAKIRMLRKVEPYKGKGIRYADEIVRLKPGKQARGK